MFTMIVCSICNRRNKCTTVDIKPSSYLSCRENRMGNPWPFGPNYIRKRLRYTLATMAFWTKLYSKTTTVYPRFHDVLDLCSKTTTVHTRFHGVLDLYSKTTTVHPRFHGVLDLYSKTTMEHTRYHGLLDQPIFENNYGTPSFPWRFGPIFENDYGTTSLPWPFGPNYIRKRLRYTPVTVAFWTKLFSKTTTVHTRYHGVLDQTKYLAINVSDNISWEKLTYT